MARVKRAVNAQKKRRVTLERASGYRGQRSRLYRKAKEQVTHSLGYAYRDRRAQEGRLPSPVDPAHQRRGPRERHDVQPVHPGPQGRRGRGRPQDPRRPRRQRRGGLRRARRDLPRQRPGRRARRRSPATPPERRRTAHAPSAGTPRAHQSPGRAGQGGPCAGPASVRPRPGSSSPRARRRSARRWPCGPTSSVTSTSTPEAAQRHADIVAAATDAGSGSTTSAPRCWRRWATRRPRRASLAVCRILASDLDEVLAGRRPRVVCVLAHVRDPGNAGTVDPRRRRRRSRRRRRQRRQRRRLRPQGGPLDGRLAVPPAGRLRYAGAGHRRRRCGPRACRPRSRRRRGRGRRGRPARARTPGCSATRRGD